MKHSEIMEIVTEGKLRYEFEIPPGYKDLKEKEGTQIFGDLIIWKQILSYSKEINKSVIFICNDLKIDWCYKDSRNRIESPRLELIKEFNDNNEKEFWMYDQSQFIYKSKELLDVDIADAKIKEISNVINLRNYEELIYQCGNCNKQNVVPFEDLYIDFECIESSDRGMGAENHYQSEDYIQCPNCGKESNLTLDIWEYPVGAHNYDEIEIEDGEIIQSPDFVGYFWDNYYDEPDEDIFRER
jgi:DNA-directed RNA polymerase subunit RPC12/RpoP